MFRSLFSTPFTRSHVVRWIGTACFAAISVSLIAGCGSSKKASSDAQIQADATPRPDASQFAISPDRQIRWEYDVLPTPAPSSKPNYLLKSYTCASGAAALNNEARGSVSDLVDILKTKATIRVLCVGLCDGQNEKANANNLGMSRAQTARKYLINKGIPKARIETASFGSSQAKAPAGESIGQGLDRKVEIWLLTE